MIDESLRIYQNTWISLKIHSSIMLPPSWWSSWNPQPWSICTSASPASTGSPLSCSRSQCSIGLSRSLFPLGLPPVRIGFSIHVRISVLAFTITAILTIELGFIVRVSMRVRGGLCNGLRSVVIRNLASIRFCLHLTIHISMGLIRIVSRLFLPRFLDEMNTWA